MDTSNPPAGWVRLRTESKEIYWERTGRIDRKRLGDLLGDALVTTAVRETAAGAVKLDEVLRWGGSVVPVVDQRDRFVKGIDREATAATIGAKPKPPKAKARNLKGHAVS